MIQKWDFLFNKLRGVFISQTPGDLRKITACSCSIHTMPIHTVLHTQGALKQIQFLMKRPITFINRTYSFIFLIRQSLMFSNRINEDPVLTCCSDRPRHFHFHSTNTISQFFPIALQEDKLQLFLHLWPSRCSGLWHSSAFCICCSLDIWLTNYSKTLHDTDCRSVLTLNRRHMSSFLHSFVGKSTKTNRHTTQTIYHACTTAVLLQFMHITPNKTLN